MTVLKKSPKVRKSGSPKGSLKDEKDGRNPHSKIITYAFRIRPHEDLKKTVLGFAVKNFIKAGAIVTAVGSLEQFNIRFANRAEETTKKGHFEIVSLVGTFSDSTCHLHLSISDNRGKTIGGHLLDGNLIYTTAEIVLIKLTELEFRRYVDVEYGYRELVVIKNSKKKR
jgi:predicted DNA-binding protein with PD1-like motif